MKAKRQALILKIIDEKVINTQQDLQDELKKEGFDVTQATVSRDIKELALIKTISPAGDYMYSVPSLKKETLKRNSRMNNGIFANAVKSIDYSANTVVLKCHNGMAQAVCAMLDDATIDNVVGTLAGDDTIFILVRTERDAVRLVKELNTILTGNS